MNFIEKLQWEFSGAVARTVVEEIDDMADAVLGPLVALVATFAFGYGGFALVSSPLAQSAVMLSVGVLLLIFGLFAGVAFAISLSAAVTYAKEPTSQPLIDEVYEDS